MEKGAYQALHNCLRMKQGESIVIISDVETLEIGVVFLKEAKKLTSKIKFFILEDFGERPLSTLPDELKNAVHHSDVGVYAAVGKEGELQSFRRPLLQECDKTKIRYANMINIDQTMMEQGMCADYKKIQAFSKKLFKIVEPAKQIKVTTKRGTDIVCDFSEHIKWINANGIIKEEHWSNLPDGEIYTCPITANGKIVVDGVLGDYFAAKYGLIENNPLTIEIQNGKIITAKCSDEELEDDFKKYINTDENSMRVSEFAFGTNLEVKELIGKLLQDEKYPGVHFAFGDGYQHITGCPWKSKVHFDAVIKNPTVFVDGNKVMEDGEYLI